MEKNIKYFERYFEGEIQEMLCHGICRSKSPDLKLWKLIDMYIKELMEITYASHYIDDFLNILCRDLEIIKREVAEFRNKRMIKEK